jgi:NAD(P)H-dependent FMN reductase
VTRVSKRPLAGKPVALMSATPGPGGGAKCLGVLEVIMGSLHADLPVASVGVGNARTRLDQKDPELRAQLEDFADAFVSVTTGIVAS